MVARLNPWVHQCTGNSHLNIYGSFLFMGNLVLKTETFIDRAKKVHGLRFSYAPTIFNGIFNTLTITCMEHGNFETRATDHLRFKYGGCKACKPFVLSAARRLTNESFLSKINLIAKEQGYGTHKVIYTGCKNKIILICHDHGEFEITPDSLINQGAGCPRCTSQRMSIRFRSNTQEFIKKAEKVWPNLYELFNVSFVEYGRNGGDKVIIDCKKNRHGKFKISPESFLIGCGCPKCANISIGDSKRLTHDQFVEKIFKVWGNELIIKSKYIDSIHKIKAKCSVDGHPIFEAKPGSMLQKHGCPVCNSSTGERATQNFLLNHNIEFEHFKRFKDFSGKGGHKYCFDFYIPHLNLFIEYDGELHYKAVKHFGGLEGLKKTQARDAIKTRWAKDNGYRLLRIPYTEFNNIEAILTAELGLIPALSGV